jgi:hypothetical protein
MGRQRMGEGVGRHARNPVIPGRAQREPGIQRTVATGAVRADSGFGLRPPRNDAVFFPEARYLAPGAMMARTSAMTSGGVA